MLENLNYEQKLWLEENNLTSDKYKFIDVAKTESLKNKWRTVFIPNVDKANLHICHICSNKERLSYDWHAFCSNKIEAKEVDKDFIREKLKNLNVELFLLWEECKTYGLAINSGVIKECKWTNTDIYIFDNSFRWTFVVTHEGWIYFKE